MDYSNKPIELRAVDSLGLGFDVASDFRLKFAKTCPDGGRLVELDESRKRDVVLPGGGATISGVSEDIRCDKGDRIRFKSDVLEFNKMSELLNQKSSIQGKVPSGYFNALFDLNGSWLNDVTDTKYLAFDGYFISLYYLHLTATPLVLQESVKKSVPTFWNPLLLARFIQTYGTHIIVGLAVGGQDLICVKQKPSSTIPPSELRRYLDDLGDSLFSDQRSPVIERKSRNGKQKVPDVFNRMLQPHTMQFTNITETSSKDGLTVIECKRGGDVFSDSHSKWLQTVANNPEAMLFKFVPITSLLNGIPGSGYLSHAINLYLRYKPALEDLEHFLEFQVPRVWAPLFCELPLRHQRRKTTCPKLQFSFLGPKIYVSTTQVISDDKPVIGLRLFLEGKKCNRLAMHVQHLSSIPDTMTHKSSKPTIPPQWRGSDDSNSNSGSGSRFLERVRWKRYSNINTSTVKHDPNWLQQTPGGVFIVTGAQLITKGKWPKTVLHLRLLFTHLPDCTIRKSEWAGAPVARKSGLFTGLSSTFTFTQRGSVGGGVEKRVVDSGVFADTPPVPVRSTKLRKFVDTDEVARGPQDSPGHWLVTAGRLVVDGGKIGLHVKFALVDFVHDLPFN
ncbi:hypothetical protein LXL04_004109 [Taraxacum kok-saghyz]